MADKRAYCKMDVGYFTNPKVAVVLAESPLAIILHLESVAYSAQHLTDGLVPIALLCRLVGAPDSDATLLFESHLWDTTGRRGFAQVHDYLEHQRSSEEAKGASDKAARAAAKRWAMPESMLPSMPNASDDAMPREKEREREQTDASFDAWWAIYPKKVGKGQALKAYRAAAKKTSTDNLASSLQKQLPWFAAQVKPEGDFRPNAATWLNGERWGDELVAPRKGRTQANPDLGDWR